ncbi:MAG TPA: hypothetical protein VGW57_08095 [Chthoniobacterales bacterium]|nr:hypothetical protein [Chthoniobacterales bacterium]
MFVLSLLVPFFLLFLCSAEAALVADGNFHPDYFAKATAPGRALLLPDGRYLQYFSVDTLTDHPTGGLIRFLPDGTLDSSFSFSRDYKEVVAAAIAPDGKVYVAATRYVYGIFESEQILRLNSDGSIDPTFTPATVGNPDTIPVVQQIVLQPNGRILVLGLFSTFGGDDARDGIVRLMPDGTVDSSFLPVTVNNVFCAAVQPDGKILIGGFFSTVNGVSTPRSVARLNADGTLDSSFQPAGFLRANRVRCILVQPDGLILLSGDFRQSTSSFSPRFPVIRIDTNGNADPTFNSSGLVQTITSARDLALQPDGKVLAAINDSIYRLNTNGSKDTSFRQPAFSDVTVNSVISRTPVTLQLYSNGAMLVGGFFTDVDASGAPAYAHLGVVRLDSAGNVDPTLVSLHHTGNEIAPSSFLRLNGDSTLVAFNSPVDPAFPYGLGRLLASGARDANFTLSSSDPKRFLELFGDPKARFNARGVEPLADGNLFVYGTSLYPFFSPYGKVHPDGTEDTTFATNHDIVFQKATVGPDGKIMGFADNDPQITAYGPFARLTADGQVDSMAGGQRGLSLSTRLSAASSITGSSKSMWATVSSLSSPTAKSFCSTLPRINSFTSCV